MTGKELIDMLKIIKEQAIKSNNDTAIIDIKIDSFNFVIGETIKALEQEPCEDCISRQAAIRVAEQGQIQGYEWQFKKLSALPSVNPQEPNTDVLDKIRAEIDEQYDRVHPYNISCAEGLEMALEIIDKYKAESEDI